MLLDQDFVRYWSARYVNEELSSLETELLDTVHKRIDARGYLTSSELEKIVRWKSKRTLSKLKDDPDTIRDVTRVALAPEPQTPDWMRHHILCILKGVRHPVASAILTICYPDTHTVIDKRTVGAFRKLHKLGLLGVKPPSGTNHYWDYLDRVFRPIAKSLGVCYRDLDRALWKWHKEGMPRTWPVANQDKATGSGTDKPASVAG